MRSSPGHGPVAERCPSASRRSGRAVYSRPAQSPAENPVTRRGVCCRQAGTVTTVHAPLPQITRPRRGRTPRADVGRKVTGTSGDGRLSSRISQRTRRRWNQRRRAKARSTTQRSIQHGATKALQEVYHAEDRAQAKKAIEAFARTYGTRWQTSRRSSKTETRPAFYAFPGAVQLVAVGIGALRFRPSPPHTSVRRPVEPGAPGRTATAGHGPEALAWSPPTEKPRPGHSMWTAPMGAAPRGKEKPVYIGLGTVVLIIVIIAVVMLLRRR